MSNNDYTFKKTQRSGSHNHYSGGVLETVRESPQETDFSQSQTSSEFIRSPGPSLFSVPYFAAYQNPSPNLPKNSLNTVEGQQLCSLDPHSHFSWADLFIPLPTEERGRFGSLGTSKRSWDDEEIDILSLGQPTQPTSRSDLILSAFSRNQPPFYQTITGSKSSLVPPSPKHPEFTLVEDGICFGPGKSVSYPPYEIKQPYPMFEFDPKPNHSAVLSPKSHLLKGTPEHQCMPDGEALFGKFLPLLKIVTKDNFEIFLVQVLKECRHVPMEDFYNLLYNETYSEAVPNVREQASGRSREAGLALCHLVLETFKTSKLPACAIQKGDSNNTSLSSINFHEFLRTFLAIKIISDMLEETEYTYPGTDSVSRVCVYKVYYIFCQKLISTYPTLSTSLSVQQNIILGQPSLGRLTRSIFPDLNIKRLGRRGESLPHYIGLRWNKAAVNDETLEMSDLAVPQIQDIFKDSRRKCRNKLAQSTVSAFHSQTQKNKRKEQPKYNKEGPSANRSFTQVYPNPVNSFVDFSCKYPSSDCSPRIWIILPNTVPQQSKWAEDTMARSLEILKGQNVDLEPLIQNYKKGMFSDDIPNGLSSTFINAIKALIAASSSVQTYMHLYLIILLLLFPVIIASDQEVTSSLKAQLRTSMRNCTAKVGSEIAQLVSLDTFKLKTFTGILEKMIRLNEMTNTKVKSCSPGSVAEQIAKDLAGAGGAKNDPVTSLSIVEESCFRVVSLYFNAYEFDINEGTTRESKLENNIAINYVTQALSEAAMLTAEMIQRISMSAKNDGLKDVAPDVPYQIFVLAVGILHEFTLTNAVIARLPSLMLNCMIAQSVGELQHIIFSAFRNRESELAKETFKTWWVFSMMFHEYKCILREVVALNQQLSELG